MRTFLAAVLLLLFATPFSRPAPLAAQDDARIRNAMAAAPRSISAAAEIREWDGRVLRPGDNGWVCLPSVPSTVGNDPMCIDEPWLAFLDAWGARSEFHAPQMGFGYMLVGDSPASNLDPFAEGPTSDNEWIEEGVPHVMIIVPDPGMLEGLSTDPANGGPWVMWRGTPYAHIMVPLPRNR